MLIDPGELGVLRGIAAAAARALRKNNAESWMALEALVKELEDLDGNETAVKRTIEGLMGIAEALEDEGVEPCATPVIPVSKVETHVPPSCGPTWSKAFAQASQSINSFASSLTTVNPGGNITVTLPASNSTNTVVNTTVSTGDMVVDKQTGSLLMYDGKSWVQVKE